MNISFFKYLRRVFRVKWDKNTGKWEKNNKELQQMSDLCPPSDTLPLARLRFFFHTLLEETCYPSEAFLNGKICAGEEGHLKQTDHRILTYSKSLAKDWKKFGILELSKKVAQKKYFQTNIYTECSLFGNSLFATVAGQSELISETNQKFPTIEEGKNILLFATDGSLTKKKKIRIGAFSVVDSFNHYFVKEASCTEKTSSTTLELLALKKLYSQLDHHLKDKAPFLILTLTDSLSAIRLTLGLDKRTEDVQILRKIDAARSSLFKKGVKDHIIHVRSHRNISVPLNSEADFYAGRIACLRYEEQHKEEFEKCQPHCNHASPCEACGWNRKVNLFLKTIHPINFFMSFWESEKKT